MAKNVLGVKLLFIIFSLAAVIGCSNDKDELADVKAKLAQAQKELERMEGRYNALAEDLKLAKASQRSLAGQYDELGNAYSDTEEVQRTLAEEYAYQLEYIDYLESEIENRDLIIEEQEAIIAEQEAAFAELMDMMGLSTSEDLSGGY